MHNGYEDDKLSSVNTLQGSNCFVGKVGENTAVSLLFHPLVLCSNVASHFIGTCLVRGQLHICFKDTNGRWLACLK